MVPIPYISNGNNSGTIRLSKSIKSGDLISFIIPYILKAGVFLQRTSGLYLNVNILYGNYSFTTIDSEHDFQCTGDRYGSCSWEGVYLSGLNFEQKLLGWNIRVGRGYYNKNSNGALFIGGGALTDYGSRMYSHGWICD